MRLLGKYKNGNFNVKLYDNGTKIRETEENEFIPIFAENCDVHISNQCDNGCEFCYANCTPSGKHGDILNPKFIDTLHPFTELAINLNFPPHPDLEEFLYRLKERRVVANLTVNQNHFVEHQDYIEDLKAKELFYGLGVSVSEKQDDEFIDLLRKYNNAVVHVINGVVDKETMDSLADKDLNVLILGYKDVGRGISLREHEEKNKEIKDKMDQMYNSLADYTERFKAIVFDNKALEQLDVKRLLTDEEWDEFYMGDDGTMTFYIDLVEQNFGKNSLATVRYDLLDNVDDMFRVIVDNN